MVEEYSYFCVLDVFYPAHVGATEQEIKERYRKLALKWHPDKQAEKDNLVATEVVV